MEDCASTTRTILLVDDEKAIRQFLRLALVDQKFHVIEAADSGQALAAAASHPGSIDLLLADILLPDLNGYELAQRVKDIHPEVRVLYISGYVGSDAVRAHLCDGSAFLQKPFQLDALIQTVQGLIRKGTNDSCAAGVRP